jgi:hypothetical protein
MRFVTTLAAAAISVFAGSAAHATELSPWMGSADQVPFQLDPATMVAVTFAAADPLQTGTTAKLACATPHCITPPEPAKDESKAGRAPQY